MSDNDNLFFSGEVALLFSSSAAFTWKRALRQKSSYLQYIYVASRDILPHNLLMDWNGAQQSLQNWTGQIQHNIHTILIFTSLLHICMHHIAKTAQNQAWRIFRFSICTCHLLHPCWRDEILVFEACMGVAWQELSRASANLSLLVLAHSSTRLERQGDFSQLERNSSSFVESWHSLIAT